MANPYGYMTMLLVSMSMLLFRFVLTIRLLVAGTLRGFEWTSLRSFSKFLIICMTFFLRRRLSSLGSCDYPPFLEVVFSADLDPLLYPLFAD